MESNMRNLFMTAVMALTAVCAMPQPAVSEYRPGRTAEGVTYYLPRTAVRIIVTTRHEMYKPGDFCKYAERYLHTENISDKEFDRWSITGIEIGTYGIPDPERMFSVKLKKGSTASDVHLTKDGILASVNAPYTEALPVEPMVTADAVSTDPHNYLTEEILMAGSTSKMAELTAKEIYSIRESRNAITRGQADYVPSDGESFRYILENLDRQEKALMQLFNGTTLSETRTSIITVIPQSDEKHIVLFRMSGKLGVLAADNLAGEPIYIDINRLETLPENTSVQTGRNGFKYCVPGRTGIRVYGTGTVYAEKEVPIAQFGNVETLSGTMFLKSDDAGVVFDTATGNVSEIIR